LSSRTQEVQSRSGSAFLSSRGPLWILVPRAFADMLAYVSLLARTPLPKLVSSGADLLSLLFFKEGSSAMSVSALPTKVDFHALPEFDGD